MSRNVAQSEAPQAMGRVCIHNPELFRSVLDRIGDKWSLFMIGVLETGPLRFTELLKVTPGISRRMLTITLRALERDGLISRTVYPEVPPRVEYAVTDLGRTLTRPVFALAQWATENQDTIMANRAAFDNGKSDQPRTVGSRTRRQLAPLPNSTQ